MNTLRSRVALGVILFLYLILGSLFAVHTPAWQAPDEPAHYNYVRYLAEEGSFPVLHVGDYPHAYLEQIKNARFQPGMSIDPIRYESHQPPLYYALLVPVYALAHGSLTALRLVSVVLGAGVVLLTYAVGLRVFQGQPALALGAAAFVAFLPQHLATVSQVGNDVLAELVVAAMLYVLVGWVQRAGATREESGGGSQRARGGACVQLPSFLGLLLGLVLITKTTAYIAIPLAGGVLAWRWRRERSPFRQVTVQALAVLLPAALIALPWYTRNLAIYGWPDFLGLQRHDAIVFGQMRAADFVVQNGWGVYWQRALEWTFKSFVGVFGWMSVWLDSRIYLALAVLGGIAAGGHLLRAVRLVSSGGRSGGRPLKSHHTQDAGRSTRHATCLLAISALLTFLAYAWYNTQFLQHQGRYLFTALIPVALAFAVGWDAVLQPRLGRWMGAALALAGIAVAAWGVSAGTGPSRWPVAILASAAVGVVLLDLGLTLLARLCQQGHTVAGHSFSLMRGAASAFPYVLLVVISAYALFGAIVPQLT